MLDKESFEMIANIVNQATAPILDRLQTISTDVAGLKMDVAVLKTNDIHRSIAIIAEGHLDLNRKLDKALEINKEKELLQLRIVYLESEIKKIKSKLELTQS